MIIPFTFTFMQGDFCLMETDFAADIDMVGPNEWIIGAFYIDVTSREKSLRGEHVYELLESEEMIKLLTVNEHLYSDFIADRVDEIQREFGFQIVDDNAEHRLGHVDLLGRRTG